MEESICICQRLELVKGRGGLVSDLSYRRGYVVRTDERDDIFAHFGVQRMCLTSDRAVEAGLMVIRLDSTGLFSHPMKKHLL